MTVYDQPTDVVNAEDVAFVRDNTEYSRVFYDILDRTAQDLQEILGMKILHVKALISLGKTLRQFSYNVQLATSGMLSSLALSSSFKWCYSCSFFQSV